MLKLAWIVTAVAILAGCAGNGTPDAIRDELQSKWAGKRADDFFVAFGPAEQAQKLSDGRMVYTWRRTSKKYESNRLIRSNETCIVSFVADPQGVIQQIGRVDDSLGEWNLSFCREQMRL